MMYFDSNENIISWNYEGLSIKYFDKASNKVRRYFIDFIIQAKCGNFIKTIWVEIKPSSETHPPKNKNNIKACITWLTNQSKWEAASALAKSKGCEFRILTEEQLS